MGKGRKPTPTKLHILRGNPSKKKNLGVKEPKPSELTTLEPPAWLRDEAKSAWFQLAPEFSAQGILTASDVPALANFCVSYADLIVAEQHLQTEGDIVTQTTAYGTIQKENPWVYVKARAQQQCDKWAAQFGVGASYRAKLSIGTDEKEDEFSAWKKGAKK
ncbi:MAG: phage terminase small subunit P27 family [Candidatus Hydrogenedentes bacterium]|nr:phage terminase small subunit P27 family [Candidatus Hydrogenedentota bacterium]